MGIDRPKILTGHVMHGRLFPRKNHFRYGIYYLALPLSQLENLPISYNARGAISFYDRDHGDGTIGTLKSWAQKILESYSIYADGEVVLVCMPRILGHVFNPVSFWLCHDKDNALKAVLCEVHNTFGEKHTYLCAHEDSRAIHSEDVFEGEKLFHVSPFLKREGSYAFRFDSGSDHFRVHIDYFDAEGKKQLVTTLAGQYEDLTKSTARSIFWRYPLVTLKTVALIHYQAMKLIVKGIRYVPKPRQEQKRISASRNLTKM
jgi:DUF1365 family protein